MSELLWGILGTGIIAAKFAAAFDVAKNAALVAVGSRKQESADAFAKAWSCAGAYGSYEALVTDPQVDAVYIATPHSFHFENVLLCLQAGKHVLCEKPFAVNETQARQLFDLAAEKGLFLMEAMWSRFVPGLIQVLDMVRQGVIGSVRQVHADFGFFAPSIPWGRHYNPALAGGALLDVGIYPLAFTYWILGDAPEKLDAQAWMTPTGVDGQNTIALRYSNGAMALLASSIETKLSNSAVILGDKGKILLDRFWCVEHITWELYNGSVYSQCTPVLKNGYEYELMEVGRCIEQGFCESPLHPWSATCSLIKTMDSIRKGWGLRYPFE